MICYKDRTFCSSETCVQGECFRLITPEIIEASNKSQLPLLMANCRDDNCGFIAEGD